MVCELYPNKIKMQALCFPNWRWEKFETARETVICSKPSKMSLEKDANVGKS